MIAFCQSVFIKDYDDDDDDDEIHFLLCICISPRSQLLCCLWLAGTLSGCL